MRNILLALVLILGLTVNAFAITAETEECSYFWTNSFASATDDPPDWVYCRSNGGKYYLQAASTYAQFATGADDITITYDTVSPDGEMFMCQTNQTEVLAQVEFTIIKH